MANQFIIQIKQALETILPVASFSATERSKEQVYRHVLIKHNGQKAFAIGCNGAQSIVRSVPLPPSDEPYEICLDGVKLRAILAGLKDVPDQELKLTWTNSSATVCVGRSKLTLPVIDPATFPYLDKLAADTFCTTIPAQVLIESLRCTVHACGVGDARHYLNGCHVKFSDGAFSVTGSDGHRISRVLKPVGCSEVAEGIVPTRFLDLVGSISKLDGDVRVRMSHNMIELTWDEGQIRSTLIDGKYPDIAAFFKGEAKPLFSCNKADLRQALTRLKATVFDKLPSVNIQINNGEIKLATLDEVKKESGVDFIGAECCEHDTDLSINIKYLEDCLNSMDEESLSFSLCAGNSVKINGVSSTSFASVIAQLRR